MADVSRLPDFNDPIARHCRVDQPLLRADMTVEQALGAIRQQGLGERIIYFYAVDEHDRLAGVLPTRRLLTAPPDTTLGELMVKRVIAIPATATVLDACEFFVLYKFFAFPVVDADRHVIGVVDIGLFTAEMLEERDENIAAQADEIFEALGFRLSHLRGASAWRVFRHRFPWLLATIFGGTMCALLAGAFEATIASSVVIAFFLTMVLGLNESVSMQTMTVTIQALRSQAVTSSWFKVAFLRELRSAVLLGLGCGALVVMIVLLWRKELTAALAIGGSIGLSLVTACLFGVSIPSLLHSLKLDPKIAAGPVTLAVTDFVALAFYFGIASLVL
ncbi:MAG: magnesium transporter MgtE [Verrucomicrobia bacterium]|nr:MAG: magnesium transporter MgtE [Verrucomicrobiota bacterium]